MLFSRLKGSSPFFLIAGPCALESADHALRMADAIAEVARRLGVTAVYKSSFDKANRTSAGSPRGLGLDASLEALRRVRDATGLPVTTDVHETWQVPTVADAVDVVQIPAFLCRQTDLLAAAGKTGKVVNVKKGQFASAAVMGHAARKVSAAAEAAGCAHGGVLLTERGTTFGYGDLVVDVRNLPRMRAAAPGALVVMDATHAVQSPPAGGGGPETGGLRRLVPTVARAAAATGIDGLFLETHDRPEEAISDSAVQWPLERLEPLVAELMAIAQASRWREDGDIG